MDIRIKKLTSRYSEEYFEVMRKVTDGLANPEFLMPMNKSEIDNLFNDDKCIVYGAFVDNKLVATAYLYYNQYNDAADYFGLQSDECGELEYMVVLPDYRGRGISEKLSERLVAEAERLRIKHLIATAHPDNIASNKTLIKLGMKNIGRFMREKKYNRNMFLLDL